MPPFDGPRCRSAMAAGLLALTACQAVPVAPASPGPRRPASAAPSPAATATAKAADATPGPVVATPTPAAGATATPTPVPTLAPPALLQAPAAASHTLTGTVTLDAGYLVGTGAGQVLSHNGGAIVAAGAGNVLSHNGGAVVSTGAGSVLSHNGGAIVAAGAGNVLSHNGGAIVSAGAGSLVAAGAGNLVAAGAGNFRLAQAGEAPAAGERLPAAGVELGVWSIRRRAWVPVGVDAAGKPVYSVYSNLAGGYELYVPAAEDDGNVIVVAVVDRQATDPRLTYGVVADPVAEAPVAIDEDTAVATAYLRAGFAARLWKLIHLLDREALLGGELKNLITKLDPASRQALEAMTDAIVERAKALGLATDEKRGRLAARRLSDFVLSGVDLAAQPLMPKPGWYGGPTETPLAVLLDIAARASAGAKAALAADPDYFTKQRYWGVLGAKYPGRFAIKRPSDVGTLLVEGYLDEIDEAQIEALVDPADPDADREDTAFYRALRTLLRSVHALDVPDAYADPTQTSPSGVKQMGSHDDQIDRLNIAVQNAMFAYLFRLMQINAEPGAVEAALGMLDDAPAPSLTPTPAP